MSKIKLIIQHEFWSRVNNKSFIIMTLLGPFILALLMIVPIGLNLSKQETSSRIMVIDDSYLFKNKIPNTENIEFVFENIDIQTAKRAYKDANYDYILFISASVLNNNNGYNVISDKVPSKIMLDYITTNIEQQMTLFKLQAIGIDKLEAQNAVTKISLNYLDIGDERTVSGEIKSTIGIFGGVLIYMFIFMYGTLIMKSVMTEKQSRIIEIIVSSVKPFELMMGKIIGTLLAGLTQFLVWVLLSGVITYLFSLYFIEPQLSQINSIPGLDNPIHIFKDLQLLNFPILIMAFIVFFVLGYFLYGSLFASIGAAVSKDSETQQFVFPLTAPLLLTFIILPEIINGASTTLTTFLSYFPFTSPIVMLVRIILGVTFWEVALSMLILLASALFFTFIAGKIYKSGILMHGQKVNYTTIKKWIFSK